MSGNIPPGGRPTAVSVHSGGSRWEDALANPEKSGGAKLRDWDACLRIVRGVMFAGLQGAKPGKPGDAKVGPSPQGTAEW